MFTSGTQALQGRTVNRDPEPYEYFNGFRNGVGGAYAGDWPRRNARPEFVVHDNPVLAYVRSVRGYWPSTAALAESMLHSIQVRRWILEQPWTSKQIDHARRVLSKLAALGETDV